MLTEKVVVELIVNFLITKPKGNWHKEKSKVADLHSHGVDIHLIGGKRNSEHFYIECKGKSYAKSADSINKQTNWMYALAQIVKRMDVSRVIKSGKHKGEPNRAYKFGLGLCAESAVVALATIPKSVLTLLNLYIFAVNDYGEVVQFTPSKFGKKYSLDKFYIKYKQDEKM